MVTSDNSLKAIIRNLRNRVSAVLKSATGGTITRDQTIRGITVSNIGAAGATVFALPPANTPGLIVEAAVEAAQSLRLDPNLLETMALPSTGVQQAAGKYIACATIGAHVRFKVITPGTWTCVNFNGTWTVEA